MQRPPDVLLFSCLIVSSLSTVHAQESPATVSRVRDLKTLIVATDAKSDSVILVPPATSVSVNRKSEKKPAGADAVDLPSWLTKQAALNGLQSTDLRPWHIAVTYDQFDEDGDNVHSGVYEEYWAGAKKIVVGKDGHVVSAHAVSGPPEGYKTCENAVRKLVFKLYLVLDKPVEVEQKVACSNN